VKRFVIVAPVCEFANRRTLAFFPQVRAIGADNCLRASKGRRHDGRAGAGRLSCCETRMNSCPAHVAVFGEDKMKGILAVTAKSSGGRRRFCDERGGGGGRAEQIRDFIPGKNCGYFSSHSGAKIIWRPGRAEDETSARQRANCAAFAEQMGNLLGRQDAQNSVRDPYGTDEVMRSFRVQKGPGCDVGYESDRAGQSFSPARSCVVDKLWWTRR